MIICSFQEALKVRAITIYTIFDKGLHVSFILASNSYSSTKNWADIIELNLLY